jgi:hypothetical protein
MADVLEIFVHRMEYFGTIDGVSQSLLEIAHAVHLPL